jgi:hypothetical protein
MRAAFIPGHSWLGREIFNPEFPAKDGEARIVAIIHEEGKNE